jgi:hypothetical protein
VRVTLSKLSSGFLLALLTALLFLAPSGRAYAQSASRSFQMALWLDPGDPTLTSADTDILMFNEGQPQPLPPAQTFMRIGLTGPTFASDRYDWSRIVAVLVDEPYNDIKNNPCYTQDGIDTAHAKDQLLATRAAELKSVAPMTRFWVNFADTQIAWMLDSQCLIIYPPDGAFLIKPYMDVVSLDSYYQSFSPNVKSYYDWLAAHRATPQQQLALIPGTFYRSGISPSTQASYLQGFFDYANNANQSCNRSLGSRGVTGSFDGCPVWIVMGWLAGNYTDTGGTTYIGELDSRSQAIATAWRQEVALPLRSDLAHQLTPGQIVSAILPLLLNY